MPDVNVAVQCFYNQVYFTLLLVLKSEYHGQEKGAHLKFQSHAEYLAVLLQNLHWCMDFHIPGAAVTDVLTPTQ